MFRPDDVRTVSGLVGQGVSSEMGISPTLRGAREHGAIVGLRPYPLMETRGCSTAVFNVTSSVHSAAAVDRALQLSSRPPKKLIGDDVQRSRHSALCPGCHYWS